MPSPEKETQNDVAFPPSLHHTHPRHHDDAPLLQPPPPPDVTLDNHHPSPQQQQHDAVSVVVEERVEEQEQEEDEEDLDAFDTGEPQEFAYVDLQTIRKEVQCPICLGIIKKTRTVMECLHRFCRECIDKSMRMGNNECPACRTHCASRRSLRDDPRFDSIIDALYPDIKKFEEEELAFCEEDETRNKQIQDSIAQVLRKQTEVLGRKRPANKDTSSPSSSRNHLNTHPRRRRKRRRNASPEYHDSDDNDDENDSDKHFDPDEHYTDIKQRKGRPRASTGSSNSPSATYPENNPDQSKQEGRRLSPQLMCSTERLAWGKGGIRSNTRYSKSARRLRLAKLVEFLRNLEENDEEYVAIHTEVKPENVQVMGMPNPNAPFDQYSTPHPSSSSSDKLSRGRMHILNKNQTLSGALKGCISNGEQVVSILEASR